MFKLHTKFDADSYLYLLSHFECDSHTVHMLTQWVYHSLLATIVKLLLFTHAHPSLLSLAARLHGCPANSSCYINNGWTFPDRPLSILYFTCMHTHTYTHIYNRIYIYIYYFKELAQAIMEAHESKIYR